MYGVNSKKRSRKQPCLCGGIAQSIVVEKNSYKVYQAGNRDAIQQFIYGLYSTLIDARKQIRLVFKNMTKRN